MKLLFFTLLVLAGISASSGLAVSTPPTLLVRDAKSCAVPTRDSCAFYDDCLESRYHCGPNGYPVGFGGKYCCAFDANRSKLSPAGNQWISDTMFCLQEQLIPEATGAVDTTCEALATKAYASHSGCYVDNGFCKLPPSDWLAIVGTVGLKTLFSSIDTIKAELATGGDCIGFFAYALTHGISW